MRVMWLAPYLERISCYIMPFFVSGMLLILSPHSAAKDLVCRRNFVLYNLRPYSHSLSFIYAICDYTSSEATYDRTIFMHVERARIHQLTLPKLPEAFFGPTQHLAKPQSFTCNCGYVHVPVAYDPSNGAPYHATYRMLHCPRSSPTWRYASGDLFETAS